MGYHSEGDTSAGGGEQGRDDQRAAHAQEENRTLANDMETLLRRNLRLGRPAIDVIAPANIREYEPISLEGESRKQRKQRKKMIAAILDQSGH